MPKLFKKIVKLLQKDNFYRRPPFTKITIDFDSSKFETSNWKKWTFDFSTLYKNLLHQDIIWILYELVSFSFNDGCKDQKEYKKYLTVMGTVFEQKRSIDLTSK